MVKTTAFSFLADAELECGCDAKECERRGLGAGGFLRRKDGVCPASRGLLRSELRRSGASLEKVNLHADFMHTIF